MTPRQIENAHLSGYRRKKEHNREYNRGHEKLDYASANSAYRKAKKNMSKHKALEAKRK